MKNSKKKSLERLEKAWKSALDKGRCLEGCILDKRTCVHLDRYLARHRDRGSSAFRPQVKLLMAGDIDEFSRLKEEFEEGGVWDLFKKLRKYGLARDQIGILIRKFAYGMSNRTILEDMAWTSHSALHRRYIDALKTLKKRGFGGFSE